MFNKANHAAKKVSVSGFWQISLFLQTPILFSVYTDNLYLAFFLAG